MKSFLIASEFSFRVVFVLLNVVSLLRHPSDTAEGESKDQSKNRKDKTSVDRFVFNSSVKMLGVSRVISLSGGYVSVHLLQPLIDVRHMQSKEPYRDDEHRKQ